ncbi:hypothetical protein CDD81_6298 [Ophiocordyceps australis]|uniref:Secreted protein n=1 Tax=Ophiocordyceps australis TaxID=1399860 RepID=A0A2C5XPK4_9HYPO|nr:hypothetical protein CDD81_6298 [Ophiocordyceps australis]
MMIKLTILLLGLLSSSALGADKKQLAKVGYRCKTGGFIWNLFTSPWKADLEFWTDGSLTVDCPTCDDNSWKNIDRRKCFITSHSPVVTSNLDYDKPQCHMLRVACSDGSLFPSWTSKSGILVRSKSKKESKVPEVAVQFVQEYTGNDFPEMQRPLDHYPEDGCVPIGYAPCQLPSGFA